MMAWLAKWPVLALAAFYLVGVVWLAFECWRAPIVNEQGDIITAPSEKSNREVEPDSGPDDVKLA
jgi:hypothetical protein